MVVTPVREDNAWAPSPVGVASSGNDWSEGLRAPTGLAELQGAAFLKTPLGVNAMTISKVLCHLLFFPFTRDFSRRFIMAPRKTILTGTGINIGFFRLLRLGIEELPQKNLHGMFTKTKFDMADEKQELGEPGLFKHVPTQQVTVPSDSPDG